MKILNIRNFVSTFLVTDYLQTFLYKASKSKDSRLDSVAHLVRVEPGFESQLDPKFLIVKN